MVQIFYHLGGLCTHQRGNPTTIINKPALRSGKDLLGHHHLTGIKTQVCYSSLYHCCYQYYYYYYYHTDVHVYTYVYVFMHLYMCIHILETGAGLDSVDDLMPNIPPKSKSLSLSDIS